MTLVLALFACSTQVTITPTQDGCTDYDFDDPAPSEVVGEVAADGTAAVWRTGALLQQTGLLFDPTIDLAGRVIDVHEAWSGGETDEQFCYQPKIEIDGLTGKLQVRWYTENDVDVPFDTVDLEAE